MARCSMGARHLRAQEESTLVPAWICSSWALGISLGLSLQSSRGKTHSTPFSPTCCASKIFATVEDYGDIFSTLQRSIPTKDLCEASTNDLVCCMTSFHSLTHENLSQQNSAANRRHTSHGNAPHAFKYSGERGCSVTN